MVTLNNISLSPMDMANPNTDRYRQSWVHPVKQFNIRNVVHSPLLTVPHRLAGILGKP